MKKLTVLICALSIGFLIYSCAKKNDSTPVNETIILPEFPSYNAELYGMSEEIIEEPSGGAIERDEHQNCCECTASGCSAKKCCSGGQGCSCTCTYSWLSGSSCSCGACSTGAAISFELWLTAGQFAIWDEFADILETEVTAASQNAMGYHIDALEAITEDDATAFETAKDNLGNAVIYLQSATKELINDFLETYNFEDDPL